MNAHNNSGVNRKRNLLGRLRVLFILSLLFAYQVLGIDRETNVTFRMFAVMVALAERVTQLE